MYTHEGDEILYVNADRSKVVPEDSEEAAFVLVGPGGQIPDDEAERLGLTKRKARTADEAGAADAKAVDGPAENKARKQVERK